jgi:hypothetical protein
MLVGDPSSGYSYKCTVNDIALQVEIGVAGNYVTLATAQTISGAKTFSNVLTLTSVANSPTDTDKFLVLNASNVVNYRTGTQVLSDIGGADDSLVVHKAGSETITGVKTFNAGLVLPNYVAINLSNSASIEGYDGKVLFRTVSGTAGWFQNNSLYLAAMDNITGTSNIGVLVKDYTGEAKVGYKTPAQMLTYLGAQGSITLTTTGTSGAATLVGNTLNIPNYAPDLSGYVPYTGATTTVDLNTRLISSGNSRIVGNDVSSGGYLGFKQFSGSSSGANGLTSVYAFGTTTLGISYSQSVGVVRSVYLSSSLISDNTAYYYSFPNKGGTFALLDDVTGAISGTTNYIPKFTSSSAIGNSVMQESGSNIGVGGSPANKLSVVVSPSSTSSDGLRIDNGTQVLQYALTGSAYTYRGVPANSGLVYSNNNLSLLSDGGYISYHTSGGEQMRLTSTGLGIGITSPLLTAAARGNITINGSTDAILAFGNAGSYSGYVYSTSAKLELDAQGSRYIQFNTNGSERMRLDASGNLGLGVTPSAWNSGAKALQVSNAGLYASTNFTNLGSNIVWLSTGNAYISNGFASLYAQESGQHRWSTAPSGTAGNAISFTQAMTLNASGNLSIGNTNNTYKLDVTGDARILSGNTSTVFNASSTLAINTLKSDLSGTSVAWLLGKANSGNNVGTITFNHISDGSSSNNLGFGFWGADNLMRLDASGNLGLGVTPSAWASYRTNFQFGTGGSLSASNESAYPDLVELSGNYYLNTSGNPVYIGSTYAQRYRQYQGQHQWFTAPSGTAGNAISFTQAMTLDASGRLGIGSTSPAGKVHIAATTGTASPGSIALAIRDAANSAYGFDFNLEGVSSGDLSLMRTEASTQYQVMTFKRSNGNVGIGTTSPTSLLHLYKSGATSQVTIEGAGASNPVLYLKNPSGYTAYIQYNTAGSTGLSIYDVTANTDRMVINSSGNVGIGTTAPKTVTNGLSLTIGDGATQTQPYLALARTATGGYWAGIRFYDNTTIKSYIEENSDFDLKFGTTNTERMRITSGGNVGIGTTSPGSKLSVVGLPTSSAGLSAGDIWNDGGTLKIV